VFILIVILLVLLQLQLRYIAQKLIMYIFLIFVEIQITCNDAYSE